MAIGLCRWGQVLRGVDGGVRTICTADWVRFTSLAGRNEGPCRAPSLWQVDVMTIRGCGPTQLLSTSPEGAPSSRTRRVSRTLARRNVDAYLAPSLSIVDMVILRQSAAVQPLSSSRRGWRRRPRPDGAVLVVSLLPIPSSASPVSLGSPAQSVHSPISTPPPPCSPPTAVGLQRPTTSPPLRPPPSRVRARMAPRHHP